MHTVSKIAVGAIGAVALMACSGASASVWVATYTGTVSSSYDQTGEFGGLGSSLDGDTFTARYTYDTALPIRATGAGSSDKLYGGINAGYGVPSPVSATLTINGVTEALAGTDSGFALNEIGYVEHKVVDSNIYTQNYVDNYAYPVGATPNLDASLPLTSAIGGYGSFSVDTLDSNTGVHDHYAYGNFDDITVQISAGGVPEPAAWALMLAGFGGLGAAVRSRRRMVIAA